MRQRPDIAKRAATQASDAGPLTKWTDMAAKHGKVVCATAVKNRADVAFAVSLAAVHAVSTGTPQV